jgi:hydroxymethylbilane synthase
MILRVGTRNSKLATAQTVLVTEALKAAHPGLTTEVVPVTTVDSSIMDKSRYVIAIEDQLRSDEIDVGVHSAKDLPGEESPGLMIVAVPTRAPRADVLLGAEKLSDLPEGASVGTSSLRRAAQLLAARPDLKVTPLRGNIDTRIEKLGGPEYDAIVLARAGLNRLGVGADIPQGDLDFIPAPGQGALALQIREIDLATVELLGAVTDTTSHRELIAERAASAALIASCNTPIGVSAETQPGEDGHDRMTVRGWLGLPDGTRHIEEATSGLASEAQLLGHLLAQRMRAEGGDELLALAEEMAA